MAKSARMAPHAVCIAAWGGGRRQPQQQLQIVVQNEFWCYAIQSWVCLGSASVSVFTLQFPESNCYKQTIGEGSCPRKYQAASCPLRGPESVLAMIRVADGKILHNFNATTLLLQMSLDVLTYDSAHEAYSMQKPQAGRVIIKLHSSIRVDWKRYAFLAPRHYHSH